MSGEFSAEEMIKRFQERSKAVKNRNLPPVGGEERQMFIRQAEEDFLDFSIIGDATAAIDDGILTLRVDLRPEG